MRHPLRRVFWSLATPAVVLASVAAAPYAAAQAKDESGEVILLTVDDATLGDLLSTPGFLGLAHEGGAALLVMQGSGDMLTDLSDAAALSGVDLGGQAYGFGSVAGPGGRPSPERLTSAARQLVALLRASTAAEAIAIVVANSPPASDGTSGNQLSATIVAQGPPDDLAQAMKLATAASLATLTSDSTRRAGVVTSTDLVESGLSIAGQGDAAFRNGARVRVVDATPPLDLYDRYVQAKRLSVPIGTAAGLFVTVGGLLAVWALAWGRSPRWLRSACAWIAITSPFLALSLLLVGHLASLTYATVIPFLIAVTALPTLALVPVARRRGTLAAVAVAGAVLLAALAVEAVMGWPAALTPLLGGSQLDGGRFFGLPNAFIGLLLGGSLYIAQRLPRTAGTALIAATGLFAGLPWTGSNLGAAVTLFAAAGIWWGLRGGVGWLRTTLAAIATVLAGTALVVVAHRFLTSAPTHITRFSEHTGGVIGLWERLVDRLQVGTDLIAANPFSLVPVIGVLVTLVVVLRPPGSIHITFQEAPVWRDALLSIVLGSIVAYLANDSGAAAIGEGFTTSLGALLFVSLLRRNDIMGEA